MLNARGLGIGLTCGLMLCCAEAKAWDDFGHMEVGAAAYKRLKPITKKRVAELLKLNPSYANWIVGASAGQQDRIAFMRAATWADAIKSSLSGYKVKAADDPQNAPTASQNIGYADRLAHSY